MLGAKAGKNPGKFCPLPDAQRKILKKALETQIDVLDKIISGEIKDFNFFDPGMLKPDKNDKPEPTNTVTIVDKSDLFWQMVDFESNRPIVAVMKGNFVFNQGMNIVSNYMNELAKENPNIKFLICSDFGGSDKNAHPEDQMVELMMKGVNPQAFAFVIGASQWNLNWIDGFQANLSPGMSKQAIESTLKSALATAKSEQ